MKKVTLLLALAVAVVALHGVPVFADASQTGCINSNYKAAGCVAPSTVPEPGSLSLLATGLVAVGGLAVAFRRKRLAQN
jgi:hypothetical protein